MNINTLIEWILKTGLPVMVIIIGMISAIKLGHFVLKKYFEKLSKKIRDVEREKKANTAKALIKSVMDIAIIGSGSLLIINKFGFNIAPLLTAAGVVGIAVGFGSQRLIEDIISGMIILAENQIRVGDVVQIANKSGLVEKLDLKMTVLRDLSGNVHYIRNGKIDTITNMTKDYSRYVFEIGIAYKENVDRVIDIIKKIDEEMRQDKIFGPLILEPIEVLGLDKFDSSAVVIKARTKTKPIRQWDVAREFNRRLKNRFDELGIEIPFPHRTLYFGDKHLKEHLVERLQQNNSI